MEGWRKPTGRGVEERMAELAPFVAGFLVTFVELEGRLGGTAIDRVRGLVEAAGTARVTVAGGVTRSEEVAALDAMGADAQVGMALYTGALPLVDAFSAPLVSERSDGLIATVVTDEAGRALGMCWSSRRSLEYALENGVGAYESRRRGLWVKGATSGATQELIRIEADCDRDALRFVVRQAGRRVLPPGHRELLGPGHGAARPGADSGAAPCHGRGRLLQPAALRGRGAARRQAPRRGCRTRGGHRSRRGGA